MVEGAHHFIAPYYYKIKFFAAPYELCAATTITHYSFLITHYSTAFYSHDIS